jgi:hypothetical protein
VRRFRKRQNALRVAFIETLVALVPDERSFVVVAASVAQMGSPRILSGLRSGPALPNRSRLRACTNPQAGPGWRFPRSKPTITGRFGSMSIYC